MSIHIIALAVGYAALLRWAWTEELEMTSPRLPLSLRLARHCSVWPMAAGVAITLLTARNPSLTLALYGLAVLFYGTPINLAGISLLALFYAKTRRVNVPTPWRQNIQISLILLLLNYGVAYFCIVIGNRALQPVLRGF